MYEQEEIIGGNNEELVISNQLEISITDASEKEEIASSCISSYFKCVINTWRIASGWFRLVNKLTLTSSILLTGLVTMAELDPNLKVNLGIAAIVCQGIALFTEEIQDYARSAIQEESINQD